MSNLPSLFTPARTRPEPAAQAPAPERRAPEATGTDFARSLASVRGLERRAAGLERSVQARAAERGAAPADERERRAADEPAPEVRSRAQVQALMLSGAMKFAATRRSDAAVTVPGAQAPVVDAAAVDAATVMPAIAVPSGGDAVSGTQMLRGIMPTLDALPQGESAAHAAQPALPNSIAASAIAKWSPATMATALDEPFDAAHSWSIETASPELTASAAATVAAMQLVATLPMSDAPAFVDEAPQLPTPSTAGNNDDAARAAWTRRMDALQSAAETSLLVEDHFDAPAIATATPVAMTTTASTLREVVPAQVTITFVDAASTATPAAVVADTHAIERDATQLAPEFRDRLQRVIERMKQEFGHDVTIVETVRSTARQAALFAQGRTTPGPVVTWTRNSRHSKGLAADLMVDGQWENPAGYSHLAQIARQEGLRTLGARDPGHVELPAEGSVSAETLGTLLGDLAGDAGDTARTMRAEIDVIGRERTANAMARVSDVAQVARVAQVAQVARVATVARADEATARREQGGADAVSPLATSAPMPQYMTDGTSAARVAVPVNNVNMADRISHLMDLQASQSARPLNSVLLRMDNANGIEDQIRIDTRGTSVDAQLGLGTAQQAADLNSRVGELRDALERRGLTADGLRVQAAPRATDSVHFSRMPAPAIDVAAMRAGADAQAQGNPRDQAARDQQHREAMARGQERSNPRSSSDDARHRSRREQPETRQ